MNKTIVLSLIGITTVLSACQKERQVTAADGNNNLSQAQIATVVAGYDYDQPLATILKDAINNASGRTKALLENASPQAVRIVPGRFVGETTFGGLYITICDPWGKICEIEVTAPRKKKNNLNAVWSGSYDEPVVGIQAPPEGPRAFLATEVTFPDATPADEFQIQHQIIE